MIRLRRGAQGAKSWRQLGPFVLISHRGDRHRQCSVGFSRSMVWLNLWVVSVQLRLGWLERLAESHAARRRHAEYVRRRTERKNLEARI